MSRGEEKLAKGISDIETEYFLLNSKPVKVESVAKPKKVKEAKNGKS